MLHVIIEGLVIDTLHPERIQHIDFLGCISCEEVLYFLVGCYDIICSTLDNTFFSCSVVDISLESNNKNWALDGLDKP